MTQQYYNAVGEMYRSNAVEQNRDYQLISQMAYFDNDVNNVEESKRKFEILNKAAPLRLLNQNDYAGILYYSGSKDKAFEILNNLKHYKRTKEQASLTLAKLQLLDSNIIAAKKSLADLEYKFIIDNFNQLADLHINFGLYNSFFDLMLKTIQDPKYLLKLTDDDLLKWSYIGQMSGDKRQVFTVTAIKSGNYLLDGLGRFRDKNDSLKVVQLIEDIHLKRKNYDALREIENY